MELLNKVYPDGQGGVQPPDELLPPTNLRLVSTTQDSITVAWDLPLQPIDNVGLDLNQGQYGYVNGLDTGFTFESFPNSVPQVSDIAADIEAENKKKFKELGEKWS